MVVNLLKSVSKLQAGEKLLTRSKVVLAFAILFFIFQIFESQHWEVFFFTYKILNSLNFNIQNVYNFNFSL